MSCVVVAMLCFCSFSAAAFAEQVENPAYKAWARFKVGTSVTFRQIGEVTLPDGPHDIGAAVTSKLIEITPEKVIIETITQYAKMPGVAPGPTTERVEIPVKIDQADAVLANLGPLDTSKEKPVVKDVKDGKDTLEISDRKYDVTTQSFAVDSAANAAEKQSATVKIWLTTEVPGGVVKYELNFKVPVTLHVTRTLTEFSIVK